MKISNSAYSSKIQYPNFTSRIVQIRDAQWVCHKVNTVFPYFSPTKFKLLFEHYLQKTTYSKKKKLIFNDFAEIYQFVKTKNIAKNTSFFDKIKNLFYSSEEEKQTVMISAIEKNIKKIGVFRKEKNEKNVFSCQNVIDMMCNHKIGNCDETATLAEFIMKLNGMTNTKCGIIYNKSKPINNAGLHSVCLFNIDNSPIEKIINNKTIIIDAWLGKADFANNMMKYYQNTCKDLLSLPQPKSITIDGLLPRVTLSNDVFEYYKNKFPELIFKSKDHKFMQKTDKTHNIFS